jgi:hypothetical protein
MYHSVQLSEKNRIGRVAQVVEHLPSKHEFKPQYQKERKGRKEGRKERKKEGKKERGKNLRTVSQSQKDNTI